MVVGESCTDIPIPFQIISLLFPCGEFARYVTTHTLDTGRVGALNFAFDFLLIAHLTRQWVASSICQTRTVAQSHTLPGNGRAAQRPPRWHKPSIPRWVLHTSFTRSGS